MLVKGQQSTNQSCSYSTVAAACFDQFLKILSCLKSVFHCEVESCRFLFVPLCSCFPYFCSMFVSFSQHNQKLNKYVTNWNFLLKISHLTHSSMLNENLRCHQIWVFLSSSFCFLFFILFIYLLFQISPLQ